MCQKYCNPRLQFAKYFETEPWDIVFFFLLQFSAYGKSWSLFNWNSETVDTPTPVAYILKCQVRRICGQYLILWSGIVFYIQCNSNTWIKYGLHKNKPCVIHIPSFIPTTVVEVNNIICNKSVYSLCNTFESILSAS